jgi:hypothetical protein
MAKTKISEFDSTPANNTDIDGINIAEGCAPSGINNAIRELMSQLKNQQTGADSDNFTVGGNLVVNGTTTHTGATTFTGAVVMSTALPVASGGTGASTAGNARTNLSAAASGANSDITSLTGLSTALTVGQGGTGTTGFNTNYVILGSNTSLNANTVAPSTAGNLLTSNGTTWVSAASQTIPAAQAKAWVRYNGVTQTVLGSYNISSVTYSAVGTYVLNFTTAMPNVNYSMAGMCGDNNGGGATLVPNIKNVAPTTSSVTVYTVYTVNNEPFESPYTMISIFGS